MKLCASGAFWLVAYPSQGHEMLFDAHTRSFAALGGVARRGIYDNMRTAVDKVKKGKGRVGQRPLCSHVQPLPVRCRLLQRRQGLGEGAWWRRTCKTAGRRIWIEAANAALRLLHRTQCLAGRALPSACGPTLRHPKHRQFTVAEMLGAGASPPDVRCRLPFDGYVETPGQGEQHLPGRRWRATATRCPANGPGKWSAPRCTRARSWWWPATLWWGHARAPGPWPDPLRLAALHRPGASASRARCATARPLPDLPRHCSACARLAAARMEATGSWRRYWPWCRKQGWTRCWWRWSWPWRHAPPSGQMSIEHVINVLARLQAQPRQRRFDQPASQPGTPGRHRAL